MKLNPRVSSSRRKSRLRHFTASSSERRVIMSAGLSKQNRKTFGIRSLPIRQGDEVLIVRGTLKGREGKVKSVYRRKYVIHIEKITRDKSNGNTVPIGIHPSKVVITKIHMDKDRQALIARKVAGKDNKNKDKSPAASSAPVPATDE